MEMILTQQDMHAPDARLPRRLGTDQDFLIQRNHRGARVEAI